MHHLQGHRGIVCGCVFSPDDTMLASASEDGVVNVWDTATWDIVQSMQFQCDHGVPICSFSPCSSALIIASDTEVASWETATWSKENLKFDVYDLLEDSNIWYSSFSQDGELFAAGTDRGMLAVWQRESV